MKFFVFILIAFHGMTVLAANNLPDNKDENLVPADNEERRYERVNRPDNVDLNTVPASEEERQEAEFPDSNSDVMDSDAIDDGVND